MGEEVRTWQNQREGKLYSRHIIGEKNDFNKEKKIKNTYF